jgi:hypothetical protein
MSSLRELVRRWLGITVPLRHDSIMSGRSDRAPADHDVSRSLLTINRQLAELRALIHQQADFTLDALHRAGWQDDADVAQQEALNRALAVVRGHGDIIVGPWTGEVGYELLYWIPFLGWLAEQGPAGQRMIAISRGGTASWYRHLTSRYVDIFDLVTPDEFRERTAGKKKQYDARRDFDRQLALEASQKLGVGELPVVHPSAMFRLFAALWRRRAAVDLVESFASFRALQPSALDTSDLPAQLPRDYVVAKFYFSKVFPDTGANRRFVAEILRAVSRQVPVVLMSTSVRLDEHSDYQAESSSGLFVVDAHTAPRTNLDLQTRLVAGARGFIGTYGGFSYLAPFHGVPSLSFFSRRDGFESHHLDLANRVFDRLLPGGFLALDRRASHLVEPAVGKWGRESCDEDSVRVGNADAYPHHMTPDPITKR